MDAILWSLVLLFYRTTLAPGSRGMAFESQSQGWNGSGLIHMGGSIISQVAGVQNSTASGVRSLSFRGTQIPRLSGPSLAFNANNRAPSVMGEWYPP